MQTLLLIPLISVFPSNLRANPANHEGSLNPTCRQTHAHFLPLLQYQILVVRRSVLVIDLMVVGAQRS